jgi:ATP-binding cassette subfamily B (MDR/TAP) protein 1
MHAAETLSALIRRLSFRAILRSDVAFFDDERNSTGALTSSLSDNAAKISGLAGATLGTSESAFVSFPPSLLSASRF